ALYFATSGEVCAFGEPLTEQSMQEEERAFAFRRRVGFLFQDPDVQLFSPTVWDEVTFAPLHLNLPKEEVVDRANWAMDLLGIQKLRDRPPHRLSGGEKKKVALASVLSLHPDVWLLDEPTASLDPRSQSRLLDFIGELGREGKTIITATHDLGIVEEIADRVVMFCEEHQIMGQGTPHDMLADYDRLVECNLVHEHRHKHAHAEHIHHHLHQPAHEHEHQQG
ncbi:MAG TPA: ABC transporter ATP-binding protein, partial [Anaerolineae bacterium]